MISKKAQQNFITGIALGIAIGIMIFLAIEGWIWMHVQDGEQEEVLDLSEYEIKGNDYCQPIEEGQGNWTVCFNIRDVLFMKGQGKYDKIVLPGGGIK